ncbi:MAG: sulfatase-like hydrolase/transferase [Bacteroidetes bacterium]|nr:sulfatase-like hydrolase/transferase [Bacteroidota bacterium]
MKLIRSFPFHSFLIIPYLSIFIYSININVLEFSMLYRTLIWGCIFTSVILLFSYFIFSKKILKAGFYTSLLIVILFSYGLVYDYLEILYFKNLWPFKNIHRYLIFSYFFLIVLVFVKTLRSKRTFLKFNLIVNCTLFGLILWNFISITFFASEQIPQLKLVREKSVFLNSKAIHTPDIYYFILDGYAGQKVLKKYYNYDNSDFSNFLVRKGFYFADSSCSNYYSTYPSLGATLNLEYNNGDINYVEKLKNNLVFQILKKNGYVIYTLNSGYTVSNNFNNVDYPMKIDGPNEFERAILRYSFLRIDDLVGVIPYIRLKSQLNELKKFNPQTKNPKFLFSHIVCPHPPFVFDRKGDRRTKNSFGDNSWEPLNCYLDQLIYLNSQIREIVTSILDKYKNKEQPIIIIQSDHGPFVTNKYPENIFDARSHIFNAFYINMNDSLYPSISSVNTFRYVFKYGLGLNIDLTKDSLKGKTDFCNSVQFQNLLIK